MGQVGLSVYRRFFSDVLFSISCRFPFVGLLGVLILSLLSFRLVFSFPVLFVFVHLMSDPSVEKKERISLKEIC